MKLTPSLLALSTLLLSPLSLAINPLPQGDVYVQGTEALAEIPAAEYRGHLLPALTDYHYCLRRTAEGRCTFTPATLKLRRGMVFDIARRFPEEVNDMLQRADGSWATPLSMAVQVQDAELVDMLLKLGALPFSPSAAYPLSQLPLLPGITPDARVSTRLHQAQKGYNPIATILQNRRGVEARKPLNEPPSARLSPTLRRLENTNENRYLGEPGVEEPHRLYIAFNRLGGAQSTLLRVQPISCLVVQPEENREAGRGCYGSIITTGRIVNALKGAIPPQEYITWEIPHEGPIDEAAAQRRAGENAAPVFFPIYPRMLEKATAEENHLKIGRIDGFELCRGEEWQAIFERVLADYPEREEPIAATAEERAAARQVVEEAAVLVRATIVSHQVQLDEQAGEVRVRYLATLRDPLKGGIIKGALRDWGNIMYERSFPLTEEWRQLHAELEAGTRSNSLNAPVILCLAPADAPEESCWVDRKARRPMKLQQAFDSLHEAPMLRAINEVVFCPMAE